MATNPMQRKARNSFLLGMLLMLVISGTVITFLSMILVEKTKADQAKVNVYVLNQNVKSGQIITTDMLEKKAVDINLIPNNATSDISIIQNYALQDKEGNAINTKNKSVDGKNVSILYVTKNNRDYEVKQENLTDNYYIEVNGQKQYLELDSVPLVAKVNMNKNTVITTDLITKGDNLVQDDVRKQQYNTIVLPMDLATGDYIDIRLMFPNGQDFIVVSKKEVEIPIIGGVDSVDTIWLNLTEDEILHMSCAIVDAAQVNGAKIYATKYTEAGMQEAATPTFVANLSTLELLKRDPNILESAIQEIDNRYNRVDSVKMRNEYINSQIQNQGSSAQSSLEANMQESITKSKNSRKEYLQSLMTVGQ